MRIGWQIQHVDCRKRKFSSLPNLKTCLPRRSHKPMAAVTLFCCNAQRLLFTPLTCLPKRPPAFKFLPQLPRPTPRLPKNERRLSLYCKTKLDDSEHTPLEKSAVEALDERHYSTIATQFFLWMLCSVYVFWLFLLPNAPGEPVWAIKPHTISLLLDLSLNFFYILPLTNVFGLHLLESPVVNPTVEGLFNLVMGWTVMFAPLLFTDQKRKHYRGSLVLLWAVQMFLTNTVLIPYMAIRLNCERKRQTACVETRSIKMNRSGVQALMTSNAGVVGVIGGIVGLISGWWFFFGRSNNDFGNFFDRWTFFLVYLSSDRPGYAFVWDLCLYSIFQPWLIGSNLSNVEDDKVEVVRFLRFVPYLGLAVYLWCLSRKEEYNS